MKKCVAILICLFVITSNIFTVSANEKISEKYFETAEFFSKKNYEECIKSSKELLNYDDSHMEAYYFIAMSAYRMGDYEFAYQTLIS